MNRRNFFKAVGAGVVATVLGGNVASQAKEVATLEFVDGFRLFPTVSESEWIHMGGRSLTGHTHAIEWFEDGGVAFDREVLEMVQALHPDQEILRVGQVSQRESEALALRDDFYYYDECL